VAWHAVEVSDYAVRTRTAHSARTLARFLAKVDPAPTLFGCLLWNGARHRNGYGSIRVGDRTDYAHRVAHELAIGAIPDRFEVDHLCGVRACVRPEHLQAVSKRENLRRAFRARRERA
jgi:HNH endonuclease